MFPTPALNSAERIQRDGQHFSHDDAVMSMSECEQILCSHCSGVDIRGRKLAAFLSSDVAEALMLLVSRRSECGVLNTNDFLSVSHHRGQDSLRLCVSECEAQKNPEFLRSADLLKHKILNLKNN